MGSTTKDCIGVSLHCLLNLKEYEKRSSKVLLPIPEILQDTSVYETNLCSTIGFHYGGYGKCSRTAHQPQSA